MLVAMRPVPSRTNTVKKKPKPGTCTPSQLSVYERGERPTPRNILERAAEATGFPVYLIDTLLPTLRSFRTASRGRFNPSRAFAARFAAEMMGLAQEAMDLILESLDPPAPEPVDAEELRSVLADISN